MRESFPSFYILSLPSSAKWSWSQPNECKHGDSEFPDTALEGGKSTMLHGKKFVSLYTAKLSTEKLQGWLAISHVSLSSFSTVDIIIFLHADQEWICVQRYRFVFNLTRFKLMADHAFTFFFIARTQACASNKCDNTACRTWLNLQEHISLLQRSCHATWLWSSVSPSSAESCIWCAAQAWAHLEL